MCYGQLGRDFCKVGDEYLFTDNYSHKVLTEAIMRLKKDLGYWNYEYKHFKPNQCLGEHERGGRYDVLETVKRSTYAIIHPLHDHFLNEGYTLLCWVGNRWEMYAGYEFRSYENIPELKAMGSQGEDSEKAALILLNHFGLDRWAERFTLDEIRHMDPDKLKGLEAELSTGVSPVA